MRWDIFEWNEPQFFQFIFVSHHITFRGKKSPSSSFLSWVLTRSHQKAAGAASDLNWETTTTSYLWMLCGEKILDRACANHSIHFRYFFFSHLRNIMLPHQQSYVVSWIDDPCDSHLVKKTLDVFGERGTLLWQARCTNWCTNIHL